MLLNYKNFINYFVAIFKVSRPTAFETETRSETFEIETETRKKGSRDERWLAKMGLETETKSRDPITDDYSYMQFGFTAIIPCIQLSADEKQQIWYLSSWKL